MQISQVWDTDSHFLSVVYFQFFSRIAVEHLRAPRQNRKTLCSFIHGLSLPSLLPSSYGVWVWGGVGKQSYFFPLHHRLTESKQQDVINTCAGICLLLISQRQTLELVETKVRKYFPDTRVSLSDLSYSIINIELFLAL